MPAGTALLFTADTLAGDSGAPVSSWAVGNAARSRAALLNLDVHTASELTGTPADMLAALVADHNPPAAWPQQPYCLVLVREPWEHTQELWALLVASAVYVGPLRTTNDSPATQPVKTLAGGAQ